MELNCRARGVIDQPDAGGAMAHSGDDRSYQRGSGAIMKDIEMLSPRDRITFGPFALSPGERLLTMDDAPVEIGGRSLDLLIVLTEQPGRVWSKRDLLRRVWNDVVVEDGSLRFHMAGLRKLLGDGRDGARYIATQVGVGYAFVAKVERQGAERPGSERQGSGQTPPAAPLLSIPMLAEAPTTAPLNLPPRMPLLIGREHDIQLLGERVIDTPLFTIVGPGGVGKTSLGTEMGHVLADAFGGHVAFVDFSLLENAALVPGMIAGAMGVVVQNDDPLAVILGHMREHPVLLLLDNCEHLIEQVAHLVERLIEAAPHARILATSREPLRVRGEHIHRLNALACPEEETALSMQEILSYPAVQLFRDRACAADTALTIDEDAARLIAGICRRLDGMALPIELAAVRVATHGIHATAQELGERFSLGWAGRRTALPRQQTLQAMLDWSYGLLSDVERVVLERLSVFVGPFSIDAALAVAADTEWGSEAVVSALFALTSKSLIAPNRCPDGSIYRLLEMTRAYAREKLRLRGAEDFNQAAARHAGFFLAELMVASSDDENLMQDTRPLRLQLGNICSALEWCFGPEGDRDLGVRLAAASTAVFLNLSHLGECQDWCARALDEMTEARHGSAIELELQGALGIALMFTRGNSRAAGQALARALEVATALDDRWNQLRMLGRLHIYHERIGEYAIAMELAGRAVKVAERIDDPEAIGIAYSLSGISQHLAGNQRRAREELEISLANGPVSSRNRTIHYGFDHRNRSGIALARTLWLSGHAAQAASLARQTVSLASRLDHPVTHCIALIWSLTLHVWMEDFAAAQQALDAFTECAQVNALGPYRVAAAGFRGEIAIRGGKCGAALTAVEDSLARLRAARYELLTTPFSITLAHGLLLENRRQEAQDVIASAILRCEAIGEGLALSELMLVKAGIMQAEQDDPEAAINLLRQALAIALRQGARAFAVKAAIALATRLEAQGRRGEAIHGLTMVMQDAGPVASTPDLRAARQLLARLSP
jgi:predicted ATPase/DNA-binding winged helix-turn-helix (wHTH) protein